MSMNAKFSLTPLNPFSYSYDGTNERYEHYASLSHYGVVIGNFRNSLLGQYEDNNVFLYKNEFVYSFPDPFPSNFLDHSLARLKFKTDEPTDKQYLILFHVECYISKIGVYLNGNLVKEEECNGDETIAILVDCPGPNIYDTLYIVPQYSAWIKGVDCYVI